MTFVINKNNRKYEQKIIYILRNQTNCAEDQFREPVSLDPQGSHHVWDWEMHKPKKDNPETSKAAGSRPCTLLGKDSWSLLFSFSWGPDGILILMYTVTRITHFIIF